MTTLYLIAYDISNNKRRTKIHKTLSGFGKWTQFSLFECFLDEKEYIMLRHRLDNILNTADDNLRIYQICANCQSKTETIGSLPPKEDTIYLL
ncbi:MAG: CRISPR-associated endonuclease Cas2 [Anaerolineales bacterium]|nr:CRISPR-associated endonuclease Cas2 [Anaerolineales bacterium]